MPNVPSISALAGFYASEHGRLRRIARRITGCREAAEDVVQEAFVKLSGRQVEADDLGLLVRTTQNIARDAMRAARVRTAYATAMTEDQVSPGFAAPDEAAASRQELDALLSAIQALPERTRRILLLSKVDQLTYPEIAKRLDVSISTVEKEMISALSFCRDWRRRHL